jgi:hypothetical protein
VDATPKGVNIERIERQGALEKVMRLCYVILVECGQSLKIEVNRVGGRRSFHPPRLSGRRCYIQVVCPTCDDLVLHLEEISNRLIKSFCP